MWPPALRQGAVHRSGDILCAITLQERHGAIPCEARRRGVVGVGTVRLEEPVSRAGVAMERHLTARARERCLERVHVRRSLKRIALGEVPEVRRFRAREVGVSGPVEKNDRADAFRIAGGKVERIVGAKREADYGKPALRMRSALREKCRGACNFCLGVRVARIECLAERFGIGDGRGDFAVIEIGCEGDEPGLRQARKRPWRRRSIPTRRAAPARRVPSRQVGWRESPEAALTDARRGACERKRIGARGAGQGFSPS